MKRKSIPAYISNDQLATRFGVTRQTVSNWRKSSNFPAPIKFSKRCSRWLLSDVDAWEKSRRKAGA